MEAPPTSRVEITFSRWGLLRRLHFRIVKVATNSSNLSLHLHREGAIERRSQEGEDISLAEHIRPRTYQPGQTANTRAADADLIRRASAFSMRRFMRESGLSQHAVERFLNGERIHPGTRKKLEQAVEKLERAGQ